MQQEVVGQGKMPWQSYAKEKGAGRNGEAGWKGRKAGRQV